MPALTEVAPLPRPLTAAGELMFVVFPTPSWPYPFHPQHLTAPFTVAHVCRSPTLMDVTPLPSPNTGVGVGELEFD